MDTEKAENWEQPQSLDLKLLVYQLNKLKQGKKVEGPKYEMNGSYRSSETIPLDPTGKRIIVLEGLFALNDQILKVAQPDYKIYVGSSKEDDDVHGRLIRRLMRDPERTGLGEKNIFKYWADIVEPMHRQYVSPTKEQADIIINNEYNPLTEAKRVPKTEIQVKYSLMNKDFERLLCQLRKLGAKSKGSFNQIDEYFLLPGRDKKEINELIRFRKQGNRYFITYKAPPKKETGRLRIKQKIEFELTPDITPQEVPKLKKTLESFGYRLIETITKKRKIYKLEGLEIAFDDVKTMGKFVEIRADSEREIDEIEKLLNSLGLSQRKRIIEPYIELLQKNK